MPYQGNEKNEHLQALAKTFGERELVDELRFARELWICGDNRSFADVWLNTLRTEVRRRHDEAQHA